MSRADIKALPVADWAAENCILMLWAIDPMLHFAFDVVNAWGVYIQDRRFLLRQDKSEERYAVRWIGAMDPL